MTVVLWMMMSFMGIMGCTNTEDGQSAANDKTSQVATEKSFRGDWSWGEIFLPVSLTEHLRENVDMLRIGYFHGGRNILLYRAMDDGAFEREGVDVAFFVRRWKKDEKFYKIWEDAIQLDLYRKFSHEGYLFGRTTGPEIVHEMDKGRLDCGMIGESTFVQMVVAEKRPFKAIIKLGQDKSSAPGKIMVMKKDITDVSTKGLKGKSFLSRESGPYDRMMVREFLEKRGVSLDDVQLLDQVPQHALKGHIENVTVDFAFLHLNRAVHVIQKGDYVMFPDYEFDFAKPEIAQAVLVCHERILERKRDSLKKFIRAYIKRIRYEHGLSDAERALFDINKTLKIDNKAIPGFNLPQYDQQPWIGESELEEISRLLHKYDFISTIEDVVPFIDHSLLEEVLNEVGKAEEAYGGAERIQTLLQGFKEVESLQNLPILPPVIKGSPAKKLLVLLDRDGDGALSNLEMVLAGAPDRTFWQFDTNGDRLIQEAEMKQLLINTDPLHPVYRGGGRWKEREEKRNQDRGEQ
jgi:ABC-type nitrate/sulfonate/bicarbonate transport system substrate-binding protein